MGRTPLIKLNRVTSGLEATVALQAEFFNPLGSVKDRIGAAMSNASIRVVTASWSQPEFVKAGW